MDYNEVRPILKGTFWKGRGKITKNEGFHLSAPAKILSTPCQDRKMQELADKDMKNPPYYNSIGFNCLFWAVGAINYGMDEPDEGECCNCDGTIWKRND